MKSFIVSIPVTQEKLGPLLAKISGDGPQQYEIQTVEDVPHYKNGKSHQRAAEPKPAKPKGKTKAEGRGQIAAAAVDALLNLPLMFKAPDLQAELAKVGLAPKNPHSTISNLIRKGFVEKMAEGRYKKVSA